MKYFAGLDWGSSSHAVCVVDQAGRIVVRTEVRHDATGLAALQRELRRLAPIGEIAVAIERSSGLIVDALLEAGYPVVPIHPNAVKACRPRYSAAGGKNDLGDAYLLADVLRTDGHRFRPLEPASDEIKALRALVRTRDDLVAQRLATANQLRAVLESFWPGAAQLFYQVDSPIALTFLRRYPTPGSAAHLGEKRMASFLRSQGYPGRKSAAEMLMRLRAAAAGRTGPLEERSLGKLVLALSRVLEALLEQVAVLTSHIEDQMDSLADGTLLMSLPRAGKLNAAQILVEIGDVRQRLTSADQLAAEAGVAPVTRQSGKSRSVVFRWACNHRLRRAITTWADNSRHASKGAASIYAAARARGRRHPHAIRIVARAWVRVLWKMWTTRTLYNAEQHTSARLLSQSA
jgi:transposase